MTLRKTTELQGLKDKGLKNKLKHSRGVAGFNIPLDTL